MCGIFGFTSEKNNKQNILKEMGLAMIHRGPDGEGYFIDCKVALGMRRLSIIDIEQGNQPFFSNDGKIVVFCNGEIYNFKTLKTDLSSKGYIFQTNSDIEVIPHLFKEYGPCFINKLNGMFAISLYNKETDELYLYRDRVGIKPLYYSTFNNNIYFASEIKSILVNNEIPKEINYQALSIYLDLMYIPHPMSPFKHIKKLDPGSYLKWCKGEFSITKYWDVILDKKQLTDEKEITDQLDFLLNDSIRMQLVSDVPLGSFLSGGVDSSLITALASLQSSDRFKTYHMRWNNVHGKQDESKYANIINEKYHTDSVIKNIEEIDIIKLLPKLLWYIEEPFADAAFVPTYLLSTIASDNVKVILSGAGGDELFGGYSHYYKFNYFSRFRTLIRHGYDPYNRYYLFWKQVHINWQKYFEWYNVQDFSSIYSYKFDNNKNIDEINAKMLNDITYYLQDDILLLTDKVTMAASIECRVPFLDHRLIEFSMSIPSSMKIKFNESKYILKKYALNYMPYEVIYRKKEGFGAPIWTWINKYKFLYFDILLENGFLVNHGLINRKILYNLLFNESINLNQIWTYWKILTLEIWFRLFIEGVGNEDIFAI